MKKFLLVLLALTLCATLLTACKKDEPDVEDNQTSGDNNQNDDNPCKDGHFYGEWVETVAPTCTKAGDERRYCNKCNAFDSREVSELGHDKIQHESKAATCTEVGWEAYETCSRCDHTTYVEISVTQHNYEGRVCSICGDVLPSKGLAIMSNGDGTCYVAGIGTCTDTDIVIPPVSPDGERVAYISSGAFQNCTNITSVTIPDSVIHIYFWAFYRCSNLSSVVIPDSITRIDYDAFYGTKIQFTEYGNGMYLGTENNPYFALMSATTPDISSCTIHENTKVIADGRGAFSNCSNLTSIVIPDGIISIGRGTFSNCSNLTSIIIPDSVTSIGDYAFSFCSSLTSVVIPDSVTTIGNFAFEDCSGLTSVVIPDSVTSIGSSAFFNCTSLTLVVIPNSVTSIGDYAFYNCTSLTSIVIPDSVTSIGNSAFSNCTSLTSVVIPDSVTYIGDSVFQNCSGLTSVVIGDSVTYIGDSAFYRCTGLTSVVIGDSVTTIGDYAFYACPNLKDVYYTGSEEEWAKITISSYNSNLYDATIHYNYVPEEQ